MSSSTSNAGSFHRDVVGLLALDDLRLEDARAFAERGVLLSQGSDDLYGVVSLANIHCAILLMDGDLEGARQSFDQRMLPHEETLQHVNVRVCFEHMRLTLRCRDRQVEQARAQLDDSQSILWLG